MSGIGVVLATQAISTVLQAGTQMEAGFRAQKRGYIQKELNDVAAGQVIAIGQRKALEEKRQSELMASRALAIAAAGGAAQDIDYLIADISGEGAYRANLAMYDAETEAERLKYEGKLAKEYGVETSEIAQQETLATVLTSGTQMYGMSKLSPTTKDLSPTTKG